MTTIGRMVAFWVVIDALRCPTRRAVVHVNVVPGSGADLLRDRIHTQIRAA